MTGCVYIVLENQSERVSDDQYPYGITIVLILRSFACAVLVLFCVHLPLNLCVSAGLEKCEQVYQQVYAINVLRARVRFTFI